MDGDWPELPYEAWRPTRDTLHMCTQIVGKLRLALSPPEPQWGHVALQVTARGLQTPPMVASGVVLDVELDLLGHEAVLRTGAGERRTVALRARPVAEFHAEFTSALDALGVAVRPSTMPSEVPDPIPFGEDRTHADYDPAAVVRFLGVLHRVDAVLREHRARFGGRTTPVNFWWGSFDLAVTRFSGRPAQPPPGADAIMRGSADAEQVNAGFWPGHAAAPAPGFFAYAHPRPAGIEDAPLRTEGAAWDDGLGEFLLPYDAVRGAASPRAALLAFLEDTYVAGAGGLGWDPAAVAER